MIELKYKKWEDISVELFYKIQNKIGYVTDNLNEVESLDTNISLLSLLCDKTEDEIANLPINDFSRLVNESAFLQKMPQVLTRESYVINGKKYNVFTNLKKMTTAQYIDFQTLQKNYTKNIKYLLACFLIPEEKEYGYDYDIDEVAEDIYKHLSIVDANSIMFFFVLQFQALTKGILTYLIRKMKKEMKKETNKVTKIKIGRAIMEMEKTMTSIKNGGGLI